MPVWLRGFANLLDQAGISFRRNGFARISHRQHPGVIRSAAVAYAGFFVTKGEVRPFLGGGEQIEGTKNMARRSSGNDIQR